MLLLDHFVAGFFFSFIGRNPNQLSTTGILVVVPTGHVLHPAIESESQRSPQGYGKFVPGSWSCSALTLDRGILTVPQEEADAVGARYSRVQWEEMLCFLACPPSLASGMFLNGWILHAGVCGMAAAVGA